MSIIRNKSGENYPIFKIQNALFLEGLQNISLQAEISLGIRLHRRIGEEASESLELAIHVGSTLGDDLLSNGDVGLCVGLLVAAGQQSCGSFELVDDGSIDDVASLSDESVQDGKATGSGEQRTVGVAQCASVFVDKGNKIVNLEHDEMQLEVKLFIIKAIKTK